MGAGARGGQGEAKTAELLQPGQEKAKGHLVAVFSCLMGRVQRGQSQTQKCTVTGQKAKVSSFSKRNTG